MLTVKSTVRFSVETNFMRLALRLARRGCGATSPNPMAA
jgi:pyrimidine deaminase RibD-like protein